MLETIISNFHLEKILWIMKSKLKYILLATILFALGAGYYADYTRTSTYVAQISFYVYSNPEYITDPTVNINSSDFTQATRLVASYMQIIRSRTFLSKVVEETGLPYSTEYIRAIISSTPIENTATFYINVADRVPQNAMKIANAIGYLAPNEITRIVKSGGIEVIDKAELPTYPYQSTNVVKTAVIGGMGGFILSTLLFLYRGLMDTTIRKKFEISNIFTIPILGDVPLLLSRSRKRPVKKILLQDSPFVYKEAYNSIRANLRFTGRGEKCPVYAITSVDASEGKTLNTINLAVAFSQIGKKVLVIDADMRKSCMSAILDIEPIDGLSEYLAGLVDTPYITEYQTNLSILTCGEFPPNPAELLSGNKWHSFLELCKKEFDMIFIDLPPAGIVADALLLVNEVTAYILIIREKITKFDREQMVVRKLEALGANICGFIYNGISVKGQDYEYKYYGKEYSN